MGTNTLAGTIRKGSVKHVIYEAIRDYPSDSFVCKDIFAKIADKRPDIKLQMVQNMVGFIFIKMKIVVKTPRVREAEGSARKLIIYERNAKATQPIIREPGIGPVKKPKKKVVEKKGPVAPSLTATQLGETVIDYINHLQERVGNLAVELDATQKSLRQEKKAHQQTKDAMQYKVAELQKANDALKTQAKQSGSGRSFNTKEVLDFQKRKANEHGVGN